MKIRGPIFFSLLAAALLIGAYFPNTTADKEAMLMHTIIGGVNQLHYSPLEIDDTFSEKVFDLYLDRIDANRRFFTQEDLARLKPFKKNLDDQALEGTYDFFNLSEELFLKKIDETQSIYQEILSKPFNFDVKEEIDLKLKKKPFAKDDAQLREYWRKNLKYDVMTRLTTKLEAKEEGDEKVKDKSYETLEKDARDAVLKVFDKWYERMAKDRRSDHLSNYLNAVTNVFDPHTSYYERKDKENFDINMSGTLEGIGARLQLEDDYTKVSSIVPGGPAWKGKELSAEDLIMKVAQGDDEPVDVAGWRLDDVVKMIRGKKGTEVRLTVKKPDGTVKVVPIVRDVVILEEGYAKSVILDYPGTVEKVGYINLPRFYADFNRTGGRSCAVDVGKEIEKLNKENVSGIILDLRNNTGGSLRDVVTMSGMFIEEGPIVQVKARDRKPEVLKDVDPKVQYDGPLIVMVNSFSASASEILAAALQDYGRAVIVGSNSTFGKGTVQRFFDLDRAIRGNSEVKPLGDVKLTIQKFYRVNGGSTQLKGVVPDIILPDAYHYTKIGEKEYEHALKWTEIDPVTYEQNVTKLDRLNAIKRASEGRIATSPVFKRVLEKAKILKDQEDRTSYPLSLTAYQTYRKDLEKTADQYDDMFEKIEGLKIQNPAVDLPFIQADSSRIARNDTWIESLQKDAYLEETLRIMEDLQQKK
ncbi:MAG: carboxy terminal-processing peptidase [Saprospiraceae bacterium]